MFQPFEEGWKFEEFQGLPGNCLGNRENVWSYMKCLKCAAVQMGSENSKILTPKKVILYQSSVSLSEFAGFFNCDKRSLHS